MILVCVFIAMNLIVSTATISQHRDQTLATNTAIVAQRAKRILSTFKGSVNIARNCDAIAVATTGNIDNNADKELVKVCALCALRANPYIV